MIQPAGTPGFERLANAATLVREVHQLKIVHRDIKPANFLTNATGRIHLADFGLAKVMDDSLAELPQFGGHVTQSGYSAADPTPGLFPWPRPIGQGRQTTRVVEHPVGLVC